MTDTTTITVRVSKELREALDRLAASTRRSKSFLAAEAIAEYVELNAWQISEIERAIDEADADDFADDSEVARTFETWSR